MPLKVDTKGQTLVIVVVTGVGWIVVVYGNVHGGMTRVQGAKQLIIGLGF
jgi:hypothetical protein